MKTRWWLITLLFVFAAGWFSGRISAPSAPNPNASETTTTSRGKDTLAAVTTREPSRKRWAEKLDAAELPALSSAFKEIPPKDRGAALEAWLAAPGNRLLDAPKLKRFHDLLDAWVAEDADAAIAWAGTLGDPAMRELAMSGVAGALSQSDPKRAFECLVAHGEFQNGIQDFRLTDLMRRLSQDALKQSPAALVELWERLPKSGPTATSRYGIHIEFEPGTDFRALEQELRGILGSNNSKPIFLGGLADAWMKQDPEGATASLVERIVAKDAVRESWQDMYWVKKNAEGGVVADQWVYGMLRDVPGDARGKFLVDSGFLAGEAKRVSDLMQGSDGAAWIGDAIQYSADNHGWMIESILNPLPMDQRIAFLKTLRGPKALESVGLAMGEWKLSDSQMAEIRKAIGSN